MVGFSRMLNESLIAKRRKRDFAAVISLENPDQRHGLRFHRSPHPDHLVIRCADLDTPAPTPYGTSIIGLFAPKPCDVWNAIEFARRHQRARLLVHCNVGVARSTAIALAVLADRFGPGREREAMAEVVRLRDCAVPNLMIVGFADALLRREGALLRTVSQRDSEIAFCRARRIANREAYLSFYRVPRELWSGDNNQNPLEV
jgi:predicted protein tyrosine phosphatase